MNGKSNKMVSGCASHIEILSQIFDDVQDEASVVAAHQTVVYPDDDDDKFTLVLTKVKAWVGRTSTQAKLLAKVIKVPVPDARSRFQTVNAFMQAEDRIFFSGGDVSFWLL